MKVTNFILFQIGWLLTIFAAANGEPYLGVIFTIIWMLIHITVFSSSKKNELLLVVIAAVSGLLLESSLLVSGFTSYPEQAMFLLPVPVWMIALWINLAATINFSLSWMKKKYVLTSVFAGIAGPLSYFAGERIGAITLQGMPSLFAISIMWVFAMPLLFWFNQVMAETRFFRGSIIENSAK